MTTDPEIVAEVRSSRFGANRLYRDAGSVAFSSTANAVLGAGFWLVAAKIFPPQQLGVMTAVLAVIVATGIVVSSGVGDAYAALLPAVGAARPRVYRRGQRVFYILAVLTGIGSALAVSTSLAAVRWSVGVAVLVIVGVVAWSAFSLQNITLMALGRARLLPAVNIATSLCKIALLPLLAITLNRHSVELAFVISAIAAVLVLQPMIARIINTGKELPSTATIPEDRAVGEFNRLVVQTVLQWTLRGAFAVTPFMVTVFAGAKAGALFALSFSIVQPLDFIVAAMCASLVVHASSTPEQATTMARAILIRAAALVAVGSVILVAALPEVLRLLNPEYAEMGATSVIAVLCIGSLIRVLYAVWYALQRSRRKLRVPVTLNLVTTGTLFAILPVLCATYGALGGALAMLISQSVLSVGAAIHLVVNHFRSAASPNAGRHRKDKSPSLATAKSSG
jgi:O-antigen/teichoic acid export membrane protein